ncbi:hypothetical protein ABZ079_09635 [Streptomyces sp. NPDC006314]|uniref:hypothetical protein n=1 Tax=Streptomyces sp. NPDC006314 TaxID=3154475 RepID=UPI0033B6C535
MRSTGRTGGHGSAWALAALALLAVSRDTGTRRPPAVSPPTAPAHVAAYGDGWQTGRRLYADGGKGTAVREVVWGGCVRRSLTARPREVVDRDRGAWVLGCRHGVGGEHPYRRPPGHALTRRETDPGLLERFRTWAGKNGRERSAATLTRVVLVHLVGSEYDVELTADADGAGRRADAERLAGAFADWWDGDDGDGAAWNLLVRSADGDRLTVRDL